MPSRAIRFFFAAVLGFASVVEFAHFRFYLKKKVYDRQIFTLGAAIACSYIASEALTGDWPSWDSPSS